jgi:transcriptional regulator with XRE-family HTH domain
MQLVVGASALLERARQALGVTQQGLGDVLHVSKRTVVRYQAGASVPSAFQLHPLARAVYARDPELASEIAEAAGTSLTRLGIAPPEPPPARPQPSVRDLVDSVVCAAAEAIAATPQAVRPALLAAFDRAASVGLTVDEVRDALRPAERRAARPRAG